MRRKKQIRKYMTQTKLKKAQKIRHKIYATEADISTLQSKLHKLNNQLVELLIGNE